MECNVSKPLVVWSVEKQAWIPAPSPEIHNEPEPYDFVGNFIGGTLPDSIYKPIGTPKTVKFNEESEMIAAINRDIDREIVKLNDTSSAFDLSPYFETDEDYKYMDINSPIIGEYRPFDIDDELMSEDDETWVDRVLQI
jgi:hypothetical protein